MTKEEALQKANEYCNEKGYTTETLTDEFKEKFADFFAKKHTETAADDDALIEDLKFNLNTAFSATSRGITAKQKAFDAKETEYKRLIAELQKKVDSIPKQKVEIPKEIQEQIDELKQFKTAEAKKEKLTRVLTLAKASVRQDLHKSFETFAKGIEVDLEKDDEEQATAMVNRFQAIFKDSIGDIKPLAPRQTHKKEEEFLSSLPKIDVV